MKKRKNMLILLIILEVTLIFITYFIFLPYNNHFVFSLFNLIIAINSIIIITIIISNNSSSAVQKTICPIEYFYNMSNDEIIEKIEENIKKLKYKKLSYEDNTYIKKEFNGSFIDQKLIIVFSDKYDENVKKRIANEVEKCKKSNDTSKSLYKRYSIQIILIVEEANIEVEDFYEVKDIYTITANYGNQIPYGVYIPTIIDKSKKRIIISGFQMYDESNILSFNSQKNKIIRLLKNIK